MSAATSVRVKYPSSILLCPYLYTRAFFEVFTNRSGKRLYHIPDYEAHPHGENMNGVKYTRFEKARIIGARSLQISYGAPVLVDYPEEMLDPIDIAMKEFEEDQVPITVVKN